MEYRRRIIASSPHLSHAEGAVATFADGTDLPLKSLIVDIDPVQSGSGDPSPSNIRPISGWDAVKVTRCGKNLLDDVTPTVVNAYVSNQNGIPILRSSGENRTVIVQLKPNTTYTYTWNQSATSGAPADDSDVILFDEYPVVGVTLGYSTGGTMRNANNKRTFNSADYKYAAIKIANIYRSNYAETLSASMLEVGPTATDYEPYNGTSVTIDLGRTVYGGTLNVLTGVLTVDMQIITGNANWGNYWNSHKAEQVDTNKRASFMLSLANETVYAQRASAKCNMLTHDTVVLNGIGNKSAFCLHPTLGKYIYVCLPLDTLGMSSATSSTSDADFRNAIKAMGNNLQIVIPLATPQTYTLDPQTVRSLVGQNNIFSDTGNVALEYWAHP